MAKSATYTMEIDGEQYEFNDDTDLTLSVLRHIKNWFPQLGTYSDFRLAYLRGDPDALCCVRWIVLRRAGKNPVEPNRSADFALGEFMNSWLGEDNAPCIHCGGVDDGSKRLPGRGWNPKNPDPEPEPERPTGVPTQGPTPDTSTATPKRSETST